MRFKRRKLLMVIGIGIIFYLVIPMRLFTDPYATLVSDEHGELLSAQIASDGQWRFPEVDSVPHKFVESIRFFEDEYFFWHWGVNPISIGRALLQNISSGSIVSGGSTISMQVIRLSRKQRSRSYIEKIIEVCQAVKLEFHYSKREILELYVSHAPYGGNVVGAEAASWRYFNRPLYLLSWAEFASLAVLPNAPSLIHPGRNRKALLHKRDRLLKKLYQNGVIDSVNYSLSMMESIPQKPNALPNKASHLLDFALKSGKQERRLHTSIDKNLQISLSEKLDSYINLMAQNEIRNACALVVSLREGAVKAYIGNSSFSGSGARYVDLIQASRSSGSILKPFLYGRALDEGLIHTSTLLRDVPISIDKYAPLNFDKQFQGVVPAGEALARSLNIPAILLLKEYGIVPFYDDLQKLGFTTINRTAGNYGLTLILGGAEVTLWDLSMAYASQAIALNQFSKEKKTVNSLNLWNDDSSFPLSDSVISEGAWWLISKALTDVKRPDLDKGWKLFSSSRQIAWKTGTSHGFRDAWAVGYDAGYLVAVWVGNAEGEGRPGLTGVSAAAPLMFQMFQHLNRSDWFSKPEMSLKRVELCETSGKVPNHSCPLVEVEVPMSAKMASSCTFHQSILLNDIGERVFMNCAQGKVRDSVWFSLDPVAAYYYSHVHQNYRPIPLFSKYCQQTDDNVLDIIYPSQNAEIIIPKGFDGKDESIVVEAAHRNVKSVVFWHLDDKFIGKTSGKHKLALHLETGKHTLLIVDELGNMASSRFEVYK